MLPGPRWRGRLHFAIEFGSARSSGGSRGARREQGCTGVNTGSAACTDLPWACMHIHLSAQRMFYCMIPPYAGSLLCSCNCVILL